MTIPSEKFYPPNMLECHALCQSLYDSGFRAFFISPGYRDAPLVASLTSLAASYGDLYLVSAVDERAGAFQALGYVKGQKKVYGAVMLCTSGTAGANYLPAVIEASKDRIPLIIITADRPSKLRYTNANQVIDQSNLFGRFVKTSICLPTPPIGAMDGGQSVSLVHMVRAHVENAVRTCMHWPAGPVHINLPLDEPLEPQKFSWPKFLEEHFPSRKLSRISKYVRSLTPTMKDPSYADMWGKIKEVLTEAKRPLLLVGRLDHDREIDSVRHFLRDTSMPVYLDVTSQLKTSHNSILGPHHKKLRDRIAEYTPDLILHLGGPLVGKHFEALQKQMAQSTDTLKVSTDHDVSDYLFSGVTHLQVAVDEFLLETADELQQLNAKCHPFTFPSAPRYSALEPLSSDTNPFAKVWPGVVSMIMNMLPPSYEIFLGNSTAIRIFDEVAGECAVNRKVYSNRGVSGIEGLLATCLGIAGATKKPVCLVLGDISMIHDLNSLLSLGLQKLPILVVILNDQRGGIFDHLPIGEFKQVCDPFITTPHGFSFAGICEMARIRYTLTSKLVDLKASLASLDEGSMPCVIELDAKMRSDNKEKQEIG